MSGIIASSPNMKSGIIGTFDDDSFFLRKGGLNYQIGDIGWDSPTYKGKNVDLSNDSKEVSVKKAGLYFFSHKFCTLSNYGVDVYGTIYLDGTNMAGAYSIDVDRTGHGSSRENIQMTWLWDCDAGATWKIANSDGYCENPIFVGHKIGD